MDEKKNPWTVLSREPMYENDWIRVDHHEVLSPGAGRASTARSISRTTPPASSPSMKTAM